MNRSVPAAEGIRLLNSIKEIDKQTKHMTEGKITIYSNNKKVIKGVMVKETKESHYI